MILELVKNVTLLITLCWMHGMLMRCLEGRKLLGDISAGVLFGLVCIMGMAMPLTLADGLIFDGRTVVLSMAAFFGGPLVAVIAGGIAALFRWWLGGIGVMPGVLNVLMPILMGLLYRHLHRRGWLPFNVLALLIFAVLVQVLQVLNLTLLPAERFAHFLQVGLLPVVTVLLPSTLIMGLLLRDIEQQKIAREALRQSEAQLRAITEAVPDLSLVLDEDGRYLKIKTPDNDLLLAGSEELLGKRLDEVLPASQADLFMQFIQRTLGSDTPQSIEYGMQTQAGHRTFEARARRLDAPIEGKRAVVLMARDITERVTLELDRRIAAIAFESQQGMLITDAQTRIVKANQAFSKITGYSEEEVLGQPTRMLGSGRQGPEFYQELWQTLTETGEWQGEIWNRRKNGEVFPEWLTISAVRDEQERVTNYVASLTDISERKSAEQKIQHLAFYDPLTGLPNRRLLRDRLQQAMILCSRKGQHAALIFMDLDDFKNVNDLHGHQVGDELLCQVADRLKTTLRELDTVARLGGDEFVILLEGLGPYAEEAGAQVEHIGSKLLQALREPYLVNDQRFNNSASLGVVLFNDEQHTVDELMQHADLSMYNSKAAGKNTLSFYDPQMQAVVSMRLRLEEDIRRGLAEGEFILYLQAQAGANGALEGAEALVRWQHPQRGLLGPGNFIEIAERCGLIEQMDLLTLRQGCELLARWAGLPQMASLSLAVNISARLLYKDDFVDLIQQILVDTQASPLRLKLEITESLLLNDKDKAVLRMQALRAMGIRFSIDDFGTGYSSMAYLQQLPLDQLKIDQSFVRDLPASTSSLAIVRAILAMAQSLELEVIAEGVEDQVQRQALYDSGCKHFQGYLFGRPMAIEAFEYVWLPVAESS
ncbi:PAS domain S-box-containing protein/diguanylate cyclase (GGDEF) domain-containing protein [Pseudomonas peli]|uniref:PAS domain S-box-containing protein/diguanylate cyclase (GGDEF) domain-containing protein n=1 Tax=Pseudomonas peli TaxID=592361 RepID=A0AB37ZCL9_9PSED|nr:EAL domain-containing protein [Pseudomonas peli]NMZ70117.1 EAL domain-containing protein [Pseudomonas peli]SCW65582.1 PAS domain S-box-containing protein/diguanylate cyclase (GGDEF) domain-containing protein [Pseudomonas peli]